MRWTPESTDFRDIYATVLQNWLGVSHHDVLGHWATLMPFL